MNPPNWESVAPICKVVNRPLHVDCMDSDHSIHTVLHISSFLLLISKEYLWFCYHLCTLSIRDTAIQELKNKVFHMHDCQLKISSN